MDLYKDYIKNLAKEGKDVVFYNSGPEHATLVMASIFENANELVKIYAGGLTGEVSNREEYRSGLKGFLNRGGRLEILLQKDKLKNDEEPKIFDLLRFYSILNPDQITIKKHSAQLTRGEGREIHFTVGDGKMYRLEDDVEKFTAEGNFNDEKNSKTLVKIFDSVLNSDDTEQIHLLGK